MGAPSVIRAHFQTGKLLSPWHTCDKAMNVQATQAPGQVFLIMTGKVFLSTHPRLSGFLHRSHVHTLLPYTLKEAPSLRAEKYQVVSQNSAATNSVLFHGLGNPVAHNVHDSQDHKAFISHLLLLQHICHLQPTVYESLPPSGVRSNLRSSVWKE